MILQGLEYVSQTLSIQPLSYLVSKDVDCQCKHTIGMTSNR